MKKATVTVSFDEEKLGAIQQFMSKKDTELQRELEDFLQKQYEKYVPPLVREYIETRDAQEVPATSRPPRPRPTPKTGEQNDII